MKNLANVMAVLVMIFAMGLMVGCGCGTTKDMSTDEMVDEVSPETDSVPETPAEDTIVPDVIEGTDNVPPADSNQPNNENGQIVDDNGNIIDHAGDAVGDAIDGTGNLIEDAGDAVGNVMEDVGDGVENMTEPNNASTTDNAPENKRSHTR